MQRRIFAIIISSIFTLSALTLSGCGVKGDLDTPPPLWGDKNKQDKPEKPSGDDQD